MDGGNDGGDISKEVVVYGATTATIIVNFGTLCRKYGWNRADCMDYLSDEISITKQSLQPGYESERLDGVEVCNEDTSADALIIDGRFSTEYVVWLMLKYHRKMVCD